MKRIIMASLMGVLWSYCSQAQITWRASGPDVTTTSNSFSCSLSNDWQNFAVTSNVLPAGVSGSVVFQYNGIGESLKVGWVSSAIDPEDYVSIRPNYFGDGLSISAGNAVKALAHGNPSSNSLLTHTAGDWYKMELDRSISGTGTLKLFHGNSNSGPWNLLSEDSYDGIYSIDLHFVIAVLYGNSLSGNIPLVDNISLGGGWVIPSSFPSPTENSYAWELVQGSTTDYYSSGKIGVGYSDFSEGDYSLYVSNGGLRADKVQIDLPTGASWPDFVFSDEYQLMTLSGIEKFILENGHLPTLPNAEDIHSNGANVEEILSGLLQSIEELTLYTIEQERIINDLKNNKDNSNQ